VLSNGLVNCWHHDNYEGVLLCLFIMSMLQERSFIVSAI